LEIKVEYLSTHIRFKNSGLEFNPLQAFKVSCLNWSKGHSVVKYFQKK
jgi:hypothetical protein